jgi:hypothetical protein
MESADRESRKIILNKSFVSASSGINVPQQCFDVRGLFLRQPAAAEVVYAGLDRQDAGGIAEALKESDIPFDVYL